MTISYLKIGQSGIMYNIPDFFADIDYLYSVTVTGPNISLLTIGEIQKIQKVNLEF